MQIRDNASPSLSAVFAEWLIVDLVVSYVSS